MAHPKWIYAGKGVWYTAVAERKSTFSLTIERLGGDGPYMEFICPSSEERYTHVGMSATLEKAKDHLETIAAGAGKRRSEHAEGKSAVHI